MKAEALGHAPGPVPPEGAVTPVTPSEAQPVDFTALLLLLLAGALPWPTPPAAPGAVDNGAPEGPTVGRDPAPPRPLPVTPGPVAPAGDAGNLGRVAPQPRAAAPLSPQSLELDAPAVPVDAARAAAGEGRPIVPFARAAERDRRLGAPERAPALQELDLAGPRAPASGVDAASGDPLPGTLGPATAGARVEPVPTSGGALPERHASGDHHVPDALPPGAATLALEAAPARQAAGGPEAPARAAATERDAPPPVADQIVRAARILLRDGGTRMEVRLEPPELGTVRISADARGEALALTITAERPDTRALLAQALPEVRHALESRGVGAATVEVHAAVADDGRRAPERRPAEPRERPTPHVPERRRAPAPLRPTSAVDITV